MPAPPIARAVSVMGAIKAHCLDCCGDDKAARNFCTCDGVHSTRCNLWLYRFGVKPNTFARRFGKWLVSPELMPDGDIPIEDLPKRVPQASQWVKERNQ